MGRSLVGAVLGLCLIATAVAAVPAGAATQATGGLSVVRTIDARLAGNFSTTGTFEPYSSPAIGDVTGDGRPELVSASLDGVVTAYSTATGVQVWRTAVSRFAIHTSPTLADMDGDGRADVIVGSMDAHVYWLNGPDGRIVRSFAEQPPLYCPPAVDCRPHGFFATPAVADITGDGRPEIIAPSWDHTIYAWQGDGRLVFRTYLEDTLWSSPAIADIDGNGTKEIIFGGDIWPGNPFNVPQGGLLWVLQSNGKPYPGYPRAFPGQVIWSSPAVVDLDGDGRLDAVFGTGTHDPFGDRSEDRKMFAITLKTGASLRGWPVQLDGRAANGPAVGDLDGDGSYEVAIGSEGGYVYAFTSDGRRLWRSCDAAGGRCGAAVVTHGSPVIADVDNDGRQEVVSSMDQSLVVRDGATGATESAYAFPGPRTNWTAAPPAVAEVDGKTMIVAQTVWQPVAHEGAPVAGDVTRIHMLTTGEPLCRADWPMFGRNVGRDSALPLGGPPFRPFQCAQPFVAQQYRDFLGRDLDAAGSAFWVTRMNSGGWNGPRVIQSFMDSKEFGRLRAPIVRVDQAVNGVPPADAGAFGALIRRFQTGTSLEDIATEIASSQSGKSDEAFVDDAYRNVYGRVATESERAAGVSEVLGNRRGAWIAAFSSTAAAVERLVPEVYVTMSYLGMLDRLPDAGGWSFWVPTVRRGGSIQRLIGGFQRSTEYTRRVR